MKLLLGVGLFMLTATACAVTVDDRYPVEERRPSEGKGPPPWAPAHGYREKMAREYVYYPTAGVYFDIGRRVYFYRSDDGWRTAAVLPSTIVIDIDRGVKMELDTDEPYAYHHEHEKKYGKHKGGREHDEGRDEDRGRGKGRGRDKDD